MEIVKLLWIQCLANFLAPSLPSSREFPKLYDRIWFWYDCIPLTLTSFFPDNIPLRQMWDTYNTQKPCPNTSSSTFNLREFLCISVIEWLMNTAEFSWKGTISCWTCYGQECQACPWKFWICRCVFGNEFIFPLFILTWVVAGESEWELPRLLSRGTSSSTQQLHQKIVHFMRWCIHTGQYSLSNKPFF